MIQQTYQAGNQNRENPAYTFHDDTTIGYGRDRDGVAKHFGDLTVEGDLIVTGASSAGSGAGATLVAGVAAGYKIARGVAAVTGTATVVTGLATVVAVVATAESDPDGTALAELSATIGDQDGAPAAGSVILKAWKITAADNGALIAATAEKNINWVAVGT